MINDEAIAIWALLGSAGKGSLLDEGAMRIRASLILDLEFEQARIAAVAHAQNHAWIPAVAEFRETVICPVVATPEEVWVELCELLTVHGYSHDFPPGPDAYSEECGATIRAMGWEDFCLGRPEVNRAHVLKEIAPQVIERIKARQLVDPNVAFALENRRRELEPGRGPQEIG